MFKKVKKVLTAILTLALVCFTAAASVPVNAATNTSWNFKNSSFKYQILIKVTIITGH